MPRLDRQKFDSDDYLKAWNAEIPGEGPDPVSVERYLRGSRIQPPAQERRWKDTVRVDPGEVVRIIARFEGPRGPMPTKILKIWFDEERNWTPK